MSFTKYGNELFINNGNIGIGKTNPTYALDVSGSINLTGTLTQNGSAFSGGTNASAINTGTLLVSYGGTGAQTFNSGAVLVGNGTGAFINNANFSWDNTNTRVGIGKTNPSVTLDVAGIIRASTYMEIGSFGGGYYSINSIYNGGWTKANASQAGFVIRGDTGGTPHLVRFSYMQQANTNFFDSFVISTDNGFIGIGKTNPGTMLDVNGTITGTTVFGTTISGTTISGTTISGAHSGSGSSLNALNSSNVNTGTLAVSYGGTGANTFTSGNVLVGNGTSTFITNNNLRWDNTNNRLGVNHSSPAYSIDVISSTGTNHAIRCYGISGDSYGSYIRFDATAQTNGRIFAIGTSGTLCLSGAGNLEFLDSTSGSLRMVILANGFIGIGKTNPGTMLDVNGTITGVGSGLSSLNSSNVSTGTLAVSYGGTGAQTFNSGAVLVGNGTGGFINNTNFFWDNTNTRVGIGKTNPAYTLDVNGSVNFTGSLLQNGTAFSAGGTNASAINTGTLAVSYGGTGANSLNSGAVLVGNGTGAFINNTNFTWDNTNTRVGIGLTNPAVTLHVSGAIAATGDITAFYSDERLKTKIDTINNPLKIINSLSTFKYKGNNTAAQYGFDTNKTHIGLSAQEVKKVLPELVSLAPFDIVDDNGVLKSKSGKNYLTIQYDRLVPILIAAIQHLSKEVEELKKLK